MRTHKSIIKTGVFEFLSEIRKGHTGFLRLDSEAERLKMLWMRRVYRNQLLHENLNTNT